MSNWPYPHIVAHRGGEFVQVVERTGRAFDQGVDTALAARCQQPQSQLQAGTTGDDDGGQLDPRSHHGDGAG